MVSVLVARVAMFPAETTDYIVYLKNWFEYFRVHGFDFTDTFSNYNYPYLYLLWFGSLFTDNALIVVKILGLLSDLLLAFGVAKIVAHYKGIWWGKIGFLITLLAPEIMLNSALWGQADSLYTAVIVWALYYFIKQKELAGWVLTGLALSIKIQTIFVLPAFIVWAVWENHKIRSICAGVGIFLVTHVPPLFAGRSFNEIFYAYTSQIGAKHPLSIAANIPNIAVFFDSEDFGNARTVMVLAAVAVVSVIMWVLIKFENKIKGDVKDLLLISGLFALILPFILPNMMDRYFFVGNTLLLILAILNYRYGILFLATQTIAVLSYSTYLHETVLSGMNDAPVIGYPILTVIVGVIIGCFVWISFGKRIKQNYEQV